MTTAQLEWADTSLSYPQTSMAVWAPSLAAMYGDRAAVVDGDRVLSYRELDERSAQFAGALSAAGVAARDVVLMHVGNCAEFHIAYYGALRVGAAVTLVNPLQPGPGLRRQIEETGAVAAVTQPQQLDTLLGAAAGTSISLIAVVSTDTVEATSAGTVRFDELLASHSTEFEPAHMSGEDVAHIAYTGVPPVFRRACGFFTAT